MIDFISEVSTEMPPKGALTWPSSEEPVPKGMTGTSWAAAIFMTSTQSAALSGLPVSRLLMIGWGLAAALGSIAGILVAPQLFVSPVMLDFVLVYALAAAILGGLDSPLGAVVAAWIIGVVENLAAAYIDVIGNDLKIAVPLILMIVILIIRPQGLFGRKVVVRV